MTLTPPRATIPALSPSSLITSALITAVLIVITMGCAPTDAPVPAGPPVPPGFEHASALLDPSAIRADIAMLASDDMEGRGPSSAGDQKARTYIAQRLAEIGLMAAGEPGENGEQSWEQRVELIGVNAAMPATWTFRRGTADVVLQRSEDFIAASGVQRPKAQIRNGELVFVGYGIDAPEQQWDDYKGLDMTGKVLVMLNNDPDWSDDLFGGNTRLYYGRWTYKYEVAAAKGAVGAIIIHTTPSAGYPWQVVQSSWTGEQFELPDEGEARTQVKAWVTEDSAHKLFELGGVDYEQAVASARSRDFQPISLGVTSNLTLGSTVRLQASANVIGKLAGTDPARAGEYIVYSAHHDHLGIGGEGEDKIYNGALDNAIGVAQLLAIARGLAAAPTPRSQLFVFVAAEEQGLLGSQYFATHPTVPVGQMVANINYDGGNIWGKTNDISYIGYGRSTLDPIVENGAALQHRVVRPDQEPDKGFFYRSDQFNFAKVGIPAIYLDNGMDYKGRPEGWGREQIEAWTEHHYHQPSDELNDSWVFDGMIEDAQLGVYAGLTLGHSAEWPAWNSGDEFEAARKAAGH